MMKKDGGERIKPEKASERLRKLENNKVCWRRTNDTG